MTYGWGIQMRKSGKNTQKQTQRNFDRFFDTSHEGKKGEN